MTKPSTLLLALCLVSACARKPGAADKFGEEAIRTPLAEAVEYACRRDMNTRAAALLIAKTRAVTIDQVKVAEIDDLIYRDRWAWRTAQVMDRSPSRVRDLVLHFYAQ